ncbi:hypothetical protein QUB05_25250 [Microcoleus sp. F10-C6]|uniref:hypothetical protein n=1 Tax=unclassified Microcoleus TaxID=2642155 RepID=UPI002FD727B6
MKRSTSVAAGKATASTKLIAAHLSNLSYVPCRRRERNGLAGPPGCGRAIVARRRFLTQSWTHDCLETGFFYEKKGCKPQIR